MLPRLILASSSIYRRELLARLGFAFEVSSPGIDETPLPHEAPQDTALRLAQAKAGVIAAREPAALVIGSDQVATLNGQQIGKPGTHERALAQLMSMRGQSVVFHTALCLADGRDASVQSENVQTTVRFRHLPEAELDAYLQIEKPYDCAGSAKNEGLGIALIESLESSDPTALTGLPLIALCSMLRRAGLPFFGRQPAANAGSPRCF
ncbi:MAG: Maf-like protein [Janthinobacterium lividum]